MAAAPRATGGSVVVAAPALPEADSKAAPHASINVDHRATLKTPLVTAAGVSEWKGDKGRGGSSSRGWCSGPDGTAYRCMDVRPTSDCGWWGLFLANVISYGIMIGVNALAATGALWRGTDGLSVSQVSTLYTTAITPAGWAFSIWGLIFTLDACFIIAQGLDREVRVAATLPHLWLMVGVTAWIMAWCNQALLLSCFFMFLGVLAPLLVLYHTIGEAAVSKATTALGAMSTRVMVSVFMGWITVASILNVASTATPKGGVGGGEWGASNYAKLMLTVAMGIGCLMLTTRGDVAYTGVLVWALLAIADNQGSASPNPGDDKVVAMARTYAVCLGLACLFFILPRCNWRK